VEENEIERPQDLVVKSVVNKSGLKVHIIQNIDRRISLDDIARAKALKLKDIITELESIVSSGTRVNIGYYIDQVVDEEKQHELYEYFRSAETDSVEEALNEMGEDVYTEEEVRLMRIKFISEFGN
jgi:ATP-dependent DNA helicase RecQ